MKKERVLALALAGLFFVSIFATIASAAPSFDASSVFDSIKNSLESLRGNRTGFIQTLFFILIFLIIATMVSFIPLFKKNKLVGLLVSIIISILSVYFMPAGLVESILHPYEAMGAAILSVIPFILMFTFTKYMLTNTFTKKVAWIFFAFVMAGLSINSIINNAKQPVVWAYGIASFLAIAMIFFNKWIDEHIWKGELEGGLNAADKRMQARIALERLREDEAKAEGIPTGKP